MSCLLVDVLGLVGESDCEFCDEDESLELMLLIHEARRGDFGAPPDVFSEAVRFKRPGRWGRVLLVSGSDFEGEVAGS